jgi:hypothetical protein
VISYCCFSQSILIILSVNIASTLHSKQLSHTWFLSCLQLDHKNTMTKWLINIILSTVGLDRRMHCQTVHPLPDLPVLQVLRQRGQPDREVSGRLRTSKAAKQNKTFSAASKNEQIQIFLSKVERTKLKQFIMMKTPFILYEESRSKQNICQIFAHFV